MRRTPAAPTRSTTVARPPDRMGDITASAHLIASPVLAGDTAFEAFFREEHERLFRRLWLITGNRDEAEEIAQEAFLRLWERSDRLADVDDPAAYLYRTAVNVFRSRYRRARLALRRAEPPRTAPDELAAADDRQWVRQILARLTPRQRAAIVLTELVGFTSEEAGRALGVKASTVRALVHQGKAAFRRTGADDA